MANKEEQELIAELKRRGRTDLIQNAERGSAATLPPEPSSVVGSPSLAESMLQEVREVGGPVLNFAKHAALPTIGNIAGTALGGMTGPAAPFAVPVLEGLGGMAGLKANEMLGISEPTAVDYGLTGALPSVLRGGAALASVASKFGTPGRAASTLNALAPDEAAAQLGKLPRPAPSSAQLYGQLAGSQMTIDATPLKNEAARLLEKEGKLAGKDPQLVSYLTRLTKKFGKNGSQINVNEFQDELVWLGRKAGQDQTGIFKDLYKFASDSMDDAIKAAQDSALDSPAVQTGATALFKARQAFKRERVFTELDDAVDSAFKLVGKGGAERQFNAKEVVKAIEGNKFFEQAFSPQEQETVKNLFYTLNEIPALKPGAGVNAGSLRAFTKTLFPMAAGSAAGMQMAGAPGASIGAAAGALIPPAVEVANLLKLAYRTETGRALLTDLLAKSQGKLTTQVLSRLSSALVAQMAPEPTPVVNPMTGMTPMNQQPFALVP